MGASPSRGTTHNFSNSQDKELLLALALWGAVPEDHTPACLRAHHLGAPFSLPSRAPLFTWRLVDGLGYMKEGPFAEVPVGAYPILCVLEGDPTLLIDATQRLRTAIASAAPTFCASNGSIGVDPAIGTQKALFVCGVAYGAGYNTHITTFRVPENDSLELSCFARVASVPGALLTAPPPSLRPPHRRCSPQLIVVLAGRTGAVWGGEGPTERRPCCSPPRRSPQLSPLQSPPRSNGSIPCTARCAPLQTFHGLLQMR